MQRGILPADFDREKYTVWLRLSGITGRTRTEDVLVNIDAAERTGGKLIFRNAGVLFFARDVRRFFNQAYITCLLAKGSDKVHILDRKDFAGGMVSDIEESIRFIERNTRTAYRIESLRREEIPGYPMAAVREAVTNAVMHRDWFIDGANVFVEIYTDRTEVSSPGGLPKGMLPSDLGRKSVRRNALIADMFHRISFIEKAGTGIKRMRDEARTRGCPEPVFENGGFFTAIFHPNPQVRSRAGETQSPTQSRDPVTRLLAFLKKGEASPGELREALGIKHRPYFRGSYIHPTLDAGFIERTIPDKQNSRLQRYRITDKGREALRRKSKEP
jgi:ATP-dependent DNA helicase RecG